MTSGSARRRGGVLGARYIILKGEHHGKVKEKAVPACQDIYWHARRYSRGSAVFEEPRFYHRLPQANRNDLHQPAEVPCRAGRPLLHHGRRHLPQGSQARGQRRSQDLPVLYVHHRARGRDRSCHRQHLQGVLPRPAERRPRRAGVYRQGIPQRDAGHRQHLPG